jgi:hypothetical protein
MVHTYPPWVTWGSNDSYLPAAFYDLTSTSSIPAFTRCIEKYQRITADINLNPSLVPYLQLELVTLGFGLAFRGIWIAQFPDNYIDVPAYVIDSPYAFSEYGGLSHLINPLLAPHALWYVRPLLHTIYSPLGIYIKAFEPNIAMSDYPRAGNIIHINEDC